MVFISFIFKIIFRYKTVKSGKGKYVKIYGICAEYAAAKRKIYVINDRKRRLLLIFVNR